VAEEQVERRLAAILAADVAGYGRLMGANELALAINPHGNMARHNAAWTYSLLGEFDGAIDLLEICLQQFGSDMKLWFKTDSDLDPIRTHPRYQKLLELAG
jgi:adenylate cyclase